MLKTGFEDITSLWHTVPRSVYFSGTNERTYHVAMDYTNTKIVAAYYDHGTNVWSSQQVVATPGSRDAHCAPTLFIDSSGYLFVTWAEGTYGDGKVHLKKSTNVEDITSWGSDLLPVSTDQDCNYARTIKMSDGTLLAFYLKGANALYRARSTDSGSTWVNEQYLALGTSNLYYHVLLSTTGRVHITWNHGDASNYRDIHYFFSDNAEDATPTWEAADGTDLSLPMSDSSTDDLVYDSNTPGWDTCYMVSMKIAADDTAYIIYKLGDSSATNKMVMSKYSSGWTQYTILTSNAIGTPESTYPSIGEGDLRIDGDDVLAAFTVLVSGDNQLVEYVSDDGGETWAKSRDVGGVLGTNCYSPTYTLHDTHSKSLTWLVGANGWDNVKTLYYEVDASWLSGFTKRIPITLNPTYVDDDAEHFPIPIIINSTAGTGNKDIATLVFTELGDEDLKLAVTLEDGTTQIYVEVEDWDYDSGTVANSTAMLWASSSDVAIYALTGATGYLYYDESVADNTTYVAVVGGRHEVWRSETQGAYLCAGLLDSTSNERTMTNNNSCVFGSAYGLDGIGVSVDDIGRSLSVADNMDVDGGAITLMGWVKLNDEITSGYYSFLGQKSATSKTAYAMFYAYNGGTRQLWFDRSKIAVADQIVKKDVSLGTSDWHFMAIRYDTTNLYGYHNSGTPFDSLAASGSGTGATTDAYIIGLYPLDDVNGMRDSCLVYDSDMGEPWVKLCYYAQSDAVITWGNEENGPTNGIVGISAASSMSLNGLRLRPGAVSISSVSSLIASGDLQKIVFQLGVLEHDTATAASSSLIMLDSTHFMLAYRGVDLDGFIKTFSIDGSYDITEIDSLEFDTTSAVYNSLVMIDSTHAILAYQGPSNNGIIKTFSVDGSFDNITEIDSLTHESGGEASHNSLIMLDSTHFMLAYRDVDDNGIIKTFSIDGSYDTITEIDSLEYESTEASSNSLVMIDSTHAILAYRGTTSDDGYIKTFSVDGSYNITQEDVLEHDTSDNLENSLIKIDSTHFMLAYSGTDLDGFIKTFSIDGNYDITQEDSLEHDTGNGRSNSLVMLDSTYFMLAYSGVDSDGFIKVFSIDENYDIAQETSFEHDTSFGFENSLVAIDSSHAILAYTDADSDGIIKTFLYSEALGEIKYGIAAISAIASVISDSLRRQQGVAAINSPSSLVLDGSRIAAAISAITSVASSISDSDRIRFALSGIQSISSLDTSGDRISFAVSAIQSIADIVAAGNIVAGGLADISSISSILAGSDKTASGIAAIQSIVSVVGDSDRVRFVVSAIEGIASMVSDGDRIAGCVVDVDAESSLAIDADRIADAIAAINAASSMSTNGDVLRSAVASIQSVALLNASGDRTRDAIAAISSIASMSADPSRLRFSEVAINAISSLLASTFTIVFGEVGIDSTAYLAIDGDKIAAAIAAISSVASLAVDGDRLAGGSVDIDAISSLTEDAERIRSVITAINAISSLDAEGDRLAGAVAAINAISSLAFDGNRIAGAISAIQSESAISSDANRISSAISAIVSIASLESQAYRKRLAEADISSDVSLAIDADRIASAIVAINAISSIIAIGESGGVFYGFAVIQSIASMACESNMIAAGIAGISSTPLLGIDGGKINQAIAAIQSLASMNASPLRIQQAIAAISSVSSLDIDVIRKLLGATDISSVSSLDADGNVFMLAVVAINSIASLAIDGSMIASAAVAIQSIASLIADGSAGILAYVAIVAVASMTSAGVKVSSGEVTITAVSSADLVALAYITQSFGYTGTLTAGDVLVIDTDAMTVKLNGSSTRPLMTGRFPLLYVGTNSLVWQDGGEVPDLTFETKHEPRYL